MAQFVSQDLEIDEIVVIAEERQEYAKGIQGAFASAYEGYGGKVVETLEFPPNTSDFEGIVERVLTLDVIRHEQPPGGRLRECLELDQLARASRASWSSSTAESATRNAG